MDEANDGQKEDYKDPPGNEEVTGTGVYINWTLFKVITFCFIILETSNDDYNDDSPDIKTISGMYLYFMYK